MSNFFKKPPVEKSLPYHHPALCLEWDVDNNGGLTPDYFKRGSSFKASWKCGKCHNTFVAPIKNRTKEKGSGCPKCRYSDPTYNFAKAHPLLLQEWDYDKNNADKLNPEEVAPKSTRKVWWVCSYCKCSWQAQIANRVNSSHLGCSKCSKQRKGVTESYNLHALFPDVAKQWDFNKNVFTPDQFSPKSHEKAYWLCDSCSHTCHASIHSRTAGRGCPMCAGKIVTKETSFAGTYPELLKYWDYSKNNHIKPEATSKKSSQKAFWKCDKNAEHTWEAAIKSIANGGNCPHCSGRAKNVLQSESFEALCPDGAALWDYEKNNGKLPSQFTPQSNQKAWFKCEEHGSWETKIQLIYLGSRCGRCYKEKGAVRKNFIENIYEKRLESE